MSTFVKASALKAAWVNLSLKLKLRFGWLDVTGYRTSFT